MAAIGGSTEHNTILVNDAELSFFESFTLQHDIPWAGEDKKNHILPLSKSYVGYITTPLRTIYLEPKYNEIGFEHIVRMYLYVYLYRPTDNAAILDVSDADTSVDIADLFIKNLKRNIREGIIRSYEKKDVLSRNVRGRVDYGKTILNMRLRKRKFVDTRVSTLSMKNTYNNLIMTALCKLRRISRYASEATSLSMYFEGAECTVKNASALLETITFNSNTARYRRTLTYAAMIIDQLSYSDTGSTVGTDSFIINFDRLFEDFVAKILKEIPEKKEFTTWSGKKRFAEVLAGGATREEREYQPDILYRYIPEDEKHDYMPSSYAVLDVKNKAYGEFKNADIYQMLTYVRLLFSQKAILLYPSFYRKYPEMLVLEPTIFSPSTISACYVNIADERGEEFLQSIHWFAEVVVKTIQDIPV